MLGRAKNIGALVIISIAAGNVACATGPARGSDEGAASQAARDEGTEPRYIDGAEGSLPRSSMAEGKYQNLMALYAAPPSPLHPSLKRFLFEKRQRPAPAGELPLVRRLVAELAPVPEGEVEVTRLGHSSVMLRSAGATWLIDPIFSKRASPVQWAGPKRFHDVPIDYKNLKDIEGVIISHDHFDHLDRDSIKLLKDRATWFAAPRGIKKLLVGWGVDPSKVKEFDWWQGASLGSMDLVATPGQHFSGRGLTGRMETLWCGWSIGFAGKKIYYTGDTGYFKGFKIAGERLGPFDLALVEAGAYDADWADIHMRPEQSVQAFLDLGAKEMLPVHDGTFTLSFHPWDEPLIRISEIAAEKGIALVTPRFGEPVLVGAGRYNPHWWEEVEARGERGEGGAARAR
jgi:L-ascorbate metabolism protein UlaG (beta-lactamase superfamily)